MVKTRSFVRFLLNGVQVELSDVSPHATLLDYLRLDQRLTGTKEGCAEGDCGACTVLVGRMVGAELVYETVNACIRFLASVDCQHVVTIEHLTNNYKGLHPVQNAMIQEHGSQCGFCTPGIVMSLYALWMETPKPSVDQIERALQGNLCRCTGYAPILRAAQSISGNPENDPLLEQRAEVSKALLKMNAQERVELDSEEGQVIVPADLDDFASVLAENPDATIVAGATDVGLWVTKFMQPISPVVHISHLQELKSCRVEGGELVVGAGVTYSEFESALRDHFSHLDGFWSRIGGWQVRNMGTIGGNIANGSPIGDTPPMLIALNASIMLRKGQNKRHILLEDFFIEYGKQDLKPGEFLESIQIPLPGKDDLFEVHKISKRKDEDISSVCGAFWMQINAGHVKQARIAFGGMAATPKRAIEVEQRLIGQPWTEETVLLAQGGFTEDFTPISDARASSEYRELLAKNLLMRVFLNSNASVEGAQ